MMVVVLKMNLKGIKKIRLEFKKYVEKTFWNAGISGEFQKTPPSPSKKLYKIFPSHPKKIDKK